MTALEDVWRLLLHRQDIGWAQLEGDWLDGPRVSVRFHENPRFYSALRNSSTGSRTTSSSIVHNISSNKEQKMSHSFSNNTHSFNTSVNFAADERSNILAWISPLNPKLRHQDVQDRRVEDVGEWLLQTAEFKSWHAGGGGGKSDNTVLFCYGDPGVGKTFIR